MSNSDRVFNARLRTGMLLCIVSCIIAMCVVGSNGAAGEAASLAETIGKMTVGGILGLVCLASLFVTYKLFVKYTNQAEAFTVAINDLKNELKKRPCVYSAEE